MVLGPTGALPSQAQKKQKNFTLKKFIFISENGAL